MPRRDVRLANPVTSELEQAFTAIRAEQQVPVQFPPEVIAEVAVAAAEPLERLDASEVEFVTIDPPGSKDLDQALHIEREGNGFCVRYAIADVPAFVPLGSALDGEARRRGCTIYAPDRRTPLYPPELSEGFASLLPGQTRPAFVWELRLAADGELAGVELLRGWVRSRAQLDYASVQAGLEGSSGRDRLPETLLLLREVGQLRLECERARGGVSLTTPEQVVSVADGGYRLHWRPPLPVEDWNAHISLLTGMAAAQLMLRAGVGIVRTLPPASAEAVTKLRQQAAGLGVAWEPETTYGQFLAGLDRANPAHLALMYAAASLFRGAGYTAVTPGMEAAQVQHAAVAAGYAHVTAPLRRLVDRFGLLVCEAVANGRPVPEPVQAALPELPTLMAAADRRANAVTRACTDAVEAAVLAARVGEVFPAVVIARRGAERTAADPADQLWQIQLVDPPVVASCRGAAEVGQSVRARLTRAEVKAASVEFEVA